MFCISDYFVFILLKVHSSYITHGSSVQLCVQTECKDNFRGDTIAYKVNRKTPLYTNPPKVAQIDAKTVCMTWKCFGSSENFRLTLDFIHVLPEHSETRGKRREITARAVVSHQ